MAKVTQTRARKSDHIQINLESNVNSDLTTGLEKYHFLHEALPDLNLNEIEMNTKVFNKYLDIPLLISSMTGGTKKAMEININLAEAAQETKIAMGVGSQRVAIENPDQEITFKVRDHAPDILLLANIGAVQLNYDYGIDECKKVVEMIEADGLILHLNALQEAVQVDGDTNYSGVYEKITELHKNLNTPLIMKETGAGIAWEEAVKMQKAGASGLEISGVGGTSWSAVEYHIAKEVGKKEMEYLGGALWNWGIPTAISVVETTQKTDLAVISSGGIRTGVEIAKSIALGADMGGMAKPFLVKAIQGREALADYVDNIIREIRVAMFLVGAKNVAELQRVPVLVMGRTAEWLKLRGFDLNMYATRA